MLRDSKESFGLLIEEQYDARAWIAGAITGLAGTDVLVSNGNWNPFLPIFEKQYNSYFDSYNCVVFGLTSGIETIIKRKYAIDINLSDRDLGIKAGTVCNVGNYMSKVANTLILEGVCLEQELLFDNTIKTCPEYYTRPDGEYSNALKDYKFNWDWVFSKDQSSIVDALKYSPIPVSVYAGVYKIVKNGIIQPTKYRSNHVELICNYKWGEWFETFNTYMATAKKRYSWNYNFGAKQRLNINLIKDMSNFNFPNNSLLKNSEVDQEIGLWLDGKLFLESERDNDYRVMKEFIARNNGDIKDKIINIKKEDWDQLEKVNLKGQPIK